jgi:hypothetical protein
MPQETFIEKVKDIRPSVEQAVGDITHALTQWRPPVTKPRERPPLVFRGVDYQDAVDNMNRSFLAQHLSDGLPLLPPTKQRVDWLLSGVDLSPDEVVGSYPDLFRPVTVRNIAVNAAMAGARPEYMPVLVAVLKALLRSKAPHFMYGSTSAFAPLIIINGPIAKELNVNSGAGLMGPGWQANACIGRAISLIAINGIGQLPGPEAPAIQSLPGRYTWCFAENEEANPWQPLHVELGYAPELSTVTVECGRGSQNFRAIWREPSQILSQIAHLLEGQVIACNAPPWDQPLILGPSDAEALSDGGWTKQDIKRYLYENARLPVSKIKAAGGAELWVSSLEKWQTACNDDTMVPILNGPDSLVIVVGGAQGSHNSTYVPCCEAKATEEIDKYKPERWRDLIAEAERGKLEVKPM